ncbi:MAG: trans-sulfuration enzyme family protein [Deinococcales bacterium]
MKPSTRAARAGIHMRVGASSPINPAIHQSTVYAFESLEQLEAVYQQEHGYIYYRNGHPNATVLEDLLCELEHGQSALVASSGMAAISALFLGNLSAGDHILADQNAYGGTFALLNADLPRFGLEASFVDASDPDTIKAALRPNSKWLHLESLSNPTLRVADLKRLVALGHECRLSVCVDNTFASPALLNPLEYGADVVVHSLAKYIGGHGTVMGGAAIGRKAILQPARDAIVRMGASISAFDAWLALLGAKTLSLRMQQHSQNALAVARYLESHTQVIRVNYPGLESHAQHQLAKQLFKAGFGGMLSFELRSGAPAAQRFVKAIATAIPLAPSLADVSSTLSYPAATSHRALSAAARAKIGVTDGLLRFSVGIEDIGDILSDIGSALELEC